MAKTKQILTTLALTAAAIAAAIPAAPRPAAACGGCFAPPDTVTSVGAHRMVISLSTERTTLWDQISYTGAPEDFVWVLPVPSPATVVELADPLFFQELENQTAPVITPPFVPPPTNCAECPYCGGSGGGGQDAAAALPDADVIVYQEETVGPYEMVVVGGSTGDSLQTWLVAHNYAVPDATVPVIDHYIATGSVFVALRLAPGEGVNRMQPVRVRYPGYMGTFPLEMVTVGASGVLELTLWVISEQRYESHAPYAALNIATSELTWDFNVFPGHNYNQLFDQKIDAAGGRGWVTEFAKPFNWIWLSTAAETEVATVGLSAPYLTRLRTRMLVDNMDADLELQPSADVGNVDNYRQVLLENGINTPVRQCPDWNGDGVPDTLDNTPTGGWYGNPPAGGANGCAAAGASGMAASGITVATLFGFVGLILLAARRRGRR
jgi:hypothetical protein